MRPRPEAEYAATFEPTDSYYRILGGSDYAFYSAPGDALEEDHLAIAMDDAAWINLAIPDTIQVEVTLHIYDTDPGEHHSFLWLHAGEAAVDITAPLAFADAELAYPTPIATGHFVGLRVHQAVDGITDSLGNKYTSETHLIHLWQR